MTPRLPPDDARDVSATPQVEPYVFRAALDVPELDVRAGDRVIVWPGAEAAVWVMRDLPENYGVLLGLLVDDALTPIGGASRAEAERALRQILALRPPRPRLLP